MLNILTDYPSPLHSPKKPTQTKTERIEHGKQKVKQLQLQKQHNAIV